MCCSCSQVFSAARAAAASLVPVNARNRARSPRRLRQQLRRRAPPQRPPRPWRARAQWRLRDPQALPILSILHPPSSLLCFLALVTLKLSEGPEGDQQGVRVAHAACRVQTDNAGQHWATHWPNRGSQHRPAGKSCVNQSRYRGAMSVILRSNGGAAARWGRWQCSNDARG
eukprot:COSAG03_NODE_1033_length_4987_cov_24.234247_4_plen_171_part_00